MNKRYAMLAASAGLLVALTGCSSDGSFFGIGTNFGYEYRQMDANEIAQRTGDVNSTSNSARVVQASTLDVYLSGSSGCPPTIESVSDADDGSVRIKLKDWSDVMCTADFVPTGYQITALQLNFSFVGKTIYTCDTEVCTNLPVTAS
jgi:hypothetical protein